MDFHIHGGSPSSSTSSTSDHRRHQNTSSPHPQNGHAPDPTHSWWESISRARSRIHLLCSILASSASDEDPLSSLADTDRPALSLLHSATAYSSVFAALSSPSAGAGDDPLCHWLYDTYLSSDPDLRLVVLSYLPLISAVYLRRVHHPAADDPIYVSGLEAVLLALYTSETKARNGQAVAISIPDLSEPSLYHTPRNPVKSANPNLKSSESSIGVLSPPLEPQMVVKSTKRASLVGVALDCYYKQISQMPSWSKLDFCKSATIWAGQHCPCASDFDKKPKNTVENSGYLHENSDEFGDDASVEADEIENVAERVDDLDIEDDNSSEVEGEDARIPLPWELLQSVLRILGHCLFGPLNVDEVKNAASMAVWRLYARASHDLVPQAILATRSLVQLDKRARETATAAAMATTPSAAGSNANIPTRVKKPEMLLASR